MSVRKFCPKYVPTGIDLNGKWYSVYLFAIKSKQNALIIKAVSYMDFKSNYTYNPALATDNVDLLMLFSFVYSFYCSVFQGYFDKFILTYPWKSIIHSYNDNYLTW